MFSLFSQLPGKPEDMKAHIESLTKVVLSEEQSDIFDHLYSCLSILDSKSSSMVSFNSIIIAVLAIFMTRTLTFPEWAFVNLGMAFILVSALLLLSVVWVHWSTTQDMQNPQEHGHHLLQVRNSRTVRYRLAWYLAVLSLASLSAFLMIRFAAGPR